MKRIFDVVLTAGGILIFAPLVLLLILLIRVKLGSPIFFVQMRPGVRGVPFRIVKFRTMTDARDTEGNLLPDSERLTKFGKFLRSTSLDELPELVNVLKGEMSLVGPRPLLMEYLLLYTTEQVRRHNVLPGITGWAQVNGRNAISWDEKFKLDVWYVDNQSFRLDMKILFLTAKKVLMREDINSTEAATMPRFMGPDSSSNKL